MNATRPEPCSEHRTTLAPHWEATQGGEEQQLVNQRWPCQAKDFETPMTFPTATSTPLKPLPVPSSAIGTAAQTPSAYWTPPTPPRRAPPSWPTASRAQRRTAGGGGEGERRCSTDAQRRHHRIFGQIHTPPPCPLRQPPRTAEPPLNDLNLACGPPIHSPSHGSTTDDLRNHSF
jgi:hypothetical protein